VRDEGVDRPFAPLVLADEPLVQLLAGPQARIDDRYGTGLAYASGHLTDPDWLSHVQNEDLTSASDATGCDHEVDSLRHRHEVAGHLGRLARRIGLGDRIDNAYLDVRFPGVEAPDGSVHFRGFLLTLDASWLLREDPQLYRLDSEWNRLRWREAVEKEPAEIVLWPDGRVEITQVAQLDAERTITVRGERISAAAWKP
jgi:hypothetical protein